MNKLDVLQALADGEAVLLPAIQTIYSGVRLEISICFNKNQYRTTVYVDEAFSTLAQSGLSRQQIEHAIKKVRLHFEEEVDELLKAIDEKSQLDSLIDVEEPNESFGF